MIIDIFILNAQKYILKSKEETVDKLNEIETIFFDLEIIKDYEKQTSE